MTLKQVKQLHSGDEVGYNDPNSEGPYTIVISTIDIIGNIVCIRGVDGEYIECFAKELY